MLTKCVCSNCGHTYLADDELGALACPRCESGSAGLGPTEDLGFENSMFEPGDDESLVESGPRRFEAKAPPPMFVTGERLLRGFVFGIVSATATGAILGAAFTATGISVVGVSAIIIAFMGGSALRGGFGGRSAHQTLVRAALICIVAMSAGFSGLIAGSWTIARFTAPRADQARKDINEGLYGLGEQYANVDDAGAAVMLKQRMEATEELQRLSDAQLEDYLWIQQAQINQPLLAYAKLWATEFPVIQVADKMKPVTLPTSGVVPIRAGELLLAIILALRAVRPRHRRARR
ncbi:MAG: TFIIB-type zinc ribbon-containing protein [Planctomycetota bacterium]